MSKFVERLNTDRFEFYNYGHALEILETSFPDEWNELNVCFDSIEIDISDIQAGGGNESPIPKKFDAVLYPVGWREIRITGDLIVKMYERNGSVRGRGNFSDIPYDELKIAGYVDGHNIDFIKSKVAFDLEWNSKDQTFDRDLLAMRTYFDCGLIDVGVIVTRAEELNEIFQKIPYKDKTLLQKYGASTTHIDKLLPRLDSRRNGGCPVLAVGIKKGCIKNGL